ncbi:MAG: choice-of-anchor J domain-containing protein, partial [Bacteroidales bacterium]|nr:choice-of-anchor J domain-containing protein [Bacteroidales bacterium]
MKKFTFLIVALLVAAMGFAQTKNSGAKIGPYHFMKPAKHINHSTRATRAAVFSEDFESDGLPTGWTVLDADGDGYNWETLAMTNESFASGYGHNSDGAAVSWSYYPTSQSSQGWSGNSLNTNDYLITPQITVPAGDSKLVFYVASFNGSAYPDDIEVKISTTGTAAEDFTTLIANETVTASVPNFVERSVSLNAYAEQQVYIAFVHQSEDCFGIILDDVSVMEIPPYDIAVTNVSFSNGSGCDLTTTDMIVTVKNNGTEAITAFSLEYSINEGTPVNVNVTANIASGSTYQHTIEGLDVSTEGIYNISVTATLENDADNSNNTNTGTVAHLAPATIPYNNTFDTDEEVAGCSIINAN